MDPARAIVTRRLAFQLRRDAAVDLSNGRRRYDALFSRIGLQVYPGSVEYRPASEVFDPLSLESGGNCPGVLLHPDTNYGVDFGEGSYPVRGCTGDSIVQHTDQIHTAGKLMVWDDEWNALIESRECVDVSVGFSIIADPTPGTVDPSMPGAAEYGTAYQIVHRSIVWDHVAGVPEGNAGTARVVVDAATVSRVLPVTRRAMAEIAAARMDSRRVFFDPAAWKTRRDSAKGKEMKVKQARQIHDAMVKLWGDSTDPKMMAAIKAMSEAAGIEPGADMAGEYIEDEDHDIEDEPEDEPSLDGPAPADPAPAHAAPAEQGGTAPAKPEDEPEDPAAKMDAKLFSRARRLANIITVGVSADPDFAKRLDSCVSEADVMRAVIEAAEPQRLDRIQRLDKRHRAAALAVHFEEVRDALAARQTYADQLLDAIRSARADQTQTDNQPKGALALMSEQAKGAK